MALPPVERAIFRNKRKTLLQHPQFRPHYRVVVVEGDGVALFSERGEDVVKGRIYEHLTVLLDGSRSVGEIVSSLRGQASRDEVFAALAYLERQGLLCEGGGRLPQEEAAFWATQNIDPKQALEKLETSTVTVKAVGDLPLDRFADALRSHRIRLSDEGAFTLVLTDDYLRDELATFNATALRMELPWMLVKPVGADVWIGPVFQPGKTGCWQCLAQRLRAHRAVRAFVEHATDQAGPIDFPLAFTTPSQEFAWNLAANRVARWIVGPETSGVEGRIISFDLGSCQTRTHVLVRRPQCLDCGDTVNPLEAPAAPVVLKRCRKTFTGDGGHRAVFPEATLDRHEHHISPITGAVRAVSRHGGLKFLPLHTYDASYNFGFRRKDLAAAHDSARSRVSGKGATDPQARASALCEALERYSGVFRGDEPLRMGRLCELENRAIHPNACMGFSDRQFLERDLWNARGHPFTFVPAPFDEQAEVPWSPVWSLTHEKERLLPTAFCYFGYPFPGGEEYCVACSNGAAAGNSLEEAVLQGLLELVERDAVALWWYNRLPRPAVDLDSFREPYLDRVRSALAKRQRELWILDLTADLEIPVFVAASRRRDSDADQILFGFGAHLDPRVAVLRAVTEMNQFLAWELTAQHPVHPGDSRDEFGLIRWLRTATLQNQPYLAADLGTSVRRASDYPTCWTDDLKEDIEFCRKVIEGRGMEVLVLDQTRPDIGLPVVKVFVPGLRHFWTRFAPGRLYDVPIELGWLDVPRSEEELNPVAMFI